MHSYRKNATPSVDDRFPPLVPQEELDDAEFHRDLIALTAKALLISGILAAAVVWAFNSWVL